MPGAVHYPPLYPVLLTPFFGLLSVNSAAIAGKVLNALLSAAAAGLITWHAAKTELLGRRIPHWAAGAVVFAATALRAVVDELIPKQMSLAEVRVVSDRLVTGAIS